MQVVSQHRRAASHRAPSARCRASRRTRRPRPRALPRRGPRRRRAPLRPRPPRPGEPKITVPGAEGDYLRTLHTRIHFRFATRFIDGVAAKQPAERSAESTRPARRDLTSAFAGTAACRTLVVNQKSGVDGVRQGGRSPRIRDRGRTRYSPPPAELFGDDGVAHFRWVFARNHNLCGEGSVRRVEAPLAQALPPPVRPGADQGSAAARGARRPRRIGRRVRTCSRWPGWNGRRRIQRPTPARRRRCSATATRRCGRRRSPRIKPALARKETAAIAGPALGALRDERRRRAGPRADSASSRAARRRCARASRPRASRR